MRSKDIQIAVPTRGEISWAIASVLQTVRDRDPNLPPVFFGIGRLAVTEARNSIVRYFMEETDKEVLIMIDDDVIPGEGFLKIADHVGDKYGMVGCPVPFYRSSLGLAFAVFDNSDKIIHRTPTQGSGVFPAGRIGTGCFAASRNLYETLGENPFDLGYDDTGAIESDDIRFCRKVIEAGFKIGCHWGQPCDHWTKFSSVHMLMMLHRQ